MACRHFLLVWRVLQLLHAKTDFVFPLVSNQANLIGIFSAWKARFHKSIKDPRGGKYEDKMTGKFQREDMGTVKVSLDYSKGQLVVDLHSAHNVAGKKSQDTYANVFLIEENPKEPFKWDKDQRVIYEEGHTKTTVFNKNLNPVFNERFVFQTDSNILKDITKTSLVISIWDEDSSSRDDYMAGITFPLEFVDNFRNLRKVVDIHLHAQEMDGYVSFFLSQICHS